jgi:hypothetical protein
MPARYDDKGRPVRSAGTVGAAGDGYTQSEVEFLHAIREYMATSGRRFPGFTEVLAVLIALGYRKTAKRRPLPRGPVVPVEE